MWAIWAAAKPIAATGEANLRSVLGIDSKSLTLIPKGSLVEVRDYSDGWCHVAWSGHDGPASGQTREQSAGPRTVPPQTGTSGSRDTPPLFDPAARIKYLHDRLRITPEQEPLWDTVAQTIRDNVRDIVPLLRERFRATTMGSALDVLHSYEALGEAQLDSLQKFIAVFDSLYASLAEDQKKIADAILREGPLNTMVCGVPETPTLLRPRQSAVPDPVGTRGVSSNHSWHRFLGDQAANEQM
jgi:hypothetical protein